MKLFKLFAFNSVLTLFLGFAAGCATGAKPQAMTPTNIKLAGKHDRSIEVEVRGGRETDPMWTSQISNEDFKSALISAITASHAFQRVLIAKGDYKLVIWLQTLDQPTVAFDMTVRLMTNWKLIETTSGKDVFQRSILSSHTATVGDAFVGVTRLRLATEGAARANIAEGLQRLSELPKHSEQ